MNSTAINYSTCAYCCRPLTETETVWVVAPDEPPRPMHEACRFLLEDLRNTARIWWTKDS